MSATLRIIGIREEELLTNRFYQAHWLESYEILMSWTSPFPLPRRNWEKKLKLKIKAYWIGFKYVFVGWEKFISRRVHFLDILNTDIIYV